MAKDNRMTLAEFLKRQEDWQAENPDQAGKDLIWISPHAQSILFKPEGN